MSKKEQLLVSAKKLFATQGYDKTSIRELAEDAGVNSSMISYYFGGKEGMVVGIFEHFFPSPPAQLNFDSSLEEIEFLITNIIKLRIYDTELIDILHSEIMLKSPRFEDIKPYISNSWSRLYDLLEIANEKHLINIPSIEVAYMYLLAGISFPYHNPMFYPNDEQLGFNEPFVNQLTTLLMKGLK